MTKEINNRIQNYDASIYKYCLERKEKSVFDLMASFFSDKSNLDNKILFNQAEQVAKEFNLNLDSNVLLSFCNRLSILQASNAMSQYMGKMDSHKNMSKQHTANIVMFGDSITVGMSYFQKKVLLIEASQVTTLKECYFGYKTSYRYNQSKFFF
ncbi:TPA: hypothetical protein ACX6PR_001802 [Photobacterium damselae]